MQRRKYSTEFKQEAVVAQLGGGFLILSTIAFYSRGKAIDNPQLSLAQR